MKTIPQYPFNDRVEFSCLKAAEGGRSFAFALELLRRAGVDGARRETSPYVGHYGISVPRRFARRAEVALYGRRS